VKVYNLIQVMEANCYVCVDVRFIFHVNLRIGDVNVNMFECLCSIDLTGLNGIGF